MRQEFEQEYLQLGLKIAYYRKLRGLTQEELAERIDRSPAFVGHVLKFVASDRRGAAFGGILAAFDTGIGTGSIAVGWMAQHLGFRGAFGVAAALKSLLAVVGMSAIRLHMDPPRTPRRRTSMPAGRRRCRWTW